MFQPLKNLFSKLTGKQPAAPDAPAAPVASEPSRLAPPPEPKQQPQPAAKSAAPAPAPEPPSDGPVETFALPVKVVLTRLPASLAALVKSTGSGDMQLPLKKVLNQLPQGVVKISFGELRNASPAGTFLEVTSQDSTVIELPLPEILARLNPALIARRQGQKTVEVPPEVGNVFGPRGETTSPVAQAAEPAAPVATAPAPIPAPAVPPPQPAAPKPVVAAPTPAPNLPKPSVSSPALPKPPAPSISSPALPKPPTPSVSSPSLPKPPAPAVPAPSLPKPPAPAPSSPSLPKPPTPVAPKIAPTNLPTPSITPKPATPAPVAVAPAPDQTQYFLEKEAVPATGSLIVSLASISGTWPEPVKQEITQQNLKGASVELPMSNIEAGLKTGKIIFTWREISGWLKPTPLASSPIGETLVELPLKVIAPLFITQHKPKAQKKVTIGENIPDIFAGGSPVPKASAAPAAAAPAPAPVAAPAPAPIPVAAPSLPKPVMAPAPAPAAVAAKVPTTLGEVFGEPEKPDWSPKEIVQKTAMVKGLAGAVIGTQDGLMVAAEVPAPLKADMLAAFLPQILSRITQYGKELQAGGDVTSMVITFDKVSWQVSKLGKVYFAAIGRPGEPLPLPQLNVICGELAKQNK